MPTQEFIGGPWDGSIEAPREWDGRWKVSMSGDQCTVFVHGDKGAVIGTYEVQRTPPYGWSWQRTEHDD